MHCACSYYRCKEFSDFHVNYFTADRGNYFVTRRYNYRCYDNQTNLDGCNFDFSANDHCYKYNTTFLTCGEPLEIPIQLSEGSFGHLEIFVYGEWGTVAQSFLASKLEVAKNVSNMVCAQLGYLSAVVEVDPHPYGAGTGPIWLQTNCSGSEKSIFDCPSHGLGVTAKSHSIDISATCLGKCMSAWGESMIKPQNQNPLP